MNRACLKAHVPAVYVALEGAFAYVGPLVLPGEGPCYLCWRMRALACADDFEVAMAREEALDARRAPLRRPLLPGLAATVDGLVAREVLALTTSALQPELAGHVVVLDPNTGDMIHDPHPSGAGVTEVDEVELILALEGGNPS